MRKEQYAGGIRGKIAAYLVDLKTGARKLIASHKNVITYGAADISARLVGGDISYAPNGIGFIYAPDMPDAPDPDERNVVWSDIASTVEAVTGNAIFCPLNPPKYASTSPSLYSGNEVGMISLSDLSASLMFTGAGYAPAPSPGADLYWQVVLVNRRYSGGSLVPTYSLFAYTTILEGGVDGVDIDENLGLLVEWPISYL